MKKIIYIILILFVFSGCSLSGHLKTGQATIGVKNISVEIARTEAEKIKGLSGRNYLPENSGMIFVLENNQLPNFWMKDMKFPLDFIWVKDNTVIEIDKNIHIYNEKGEITSNISSHYLPDYVLEVNSGFCDKNNIQIGDNFELKY